MSASSMCFFPGRVDAGTSLWILLYWKELSGFFGLVSVIELLVLWIGRVGTAICFASTISLLASREVEGSTLSAAAKEISMY